MSDELKEVEMQNEEDIESADLIKVNKNIPYFLVNQELEGSANDFLSELRKIYSFYRIYYNGAKFYSEGTNGDYVPANLRYKMAASLINKEARFMFAETPSIEVTSKGSRDEVTDDVKSSIDVINNFLKEVLDVNDFENNLIKACKDCLIGKRVACLINFNEEDGITITFLPSTQFLYENKFGSANVIQKFVAFEVISNSSNQKEKRIFKKKYELKEDKKVYLTEEIYNGSGALVESIQEEKEIALPFIPVCIFINDGLSGDTRGESEIEALKDYERWYSRLSNADIDAERKSMNPTKYLVDMDNNSTKKLPTSPGAVWDLGSDQNLTTPHPSVGMLEPNMSYSEPLKTSLDRIKTTGYEEIDMPNITLESMQGTITSGKALKAIYWPLIIRSGEKFKMWKTQLRRMVNIIIQGAFVFDNCIKMYSNSELMPVEYEINIEQNLPLPEDEVEEKTMDLSEVESKAMSRKSYMRKWRGLTNAEIDEELKQIALERQMLEDSAFPNNGFEDNPENAQETAEQTF